MPDNCKIRNLKCIKNSTQYFTNWDILKSTCRQDIDNLINVKLTLMIKRFFGKNGSDINFYPGNVFKVFIDCIPLL